MTRPAWIAACILSLLLGGCAVRTTKQVAWLPANEHHAKINLVTYWTENNQECGNVFWFDDEDGASAVRWGVYFTPSSGGIINFPNRDYAEKYVEKWCKP